MCQLHIARVGRNKDKVTRKKPTNKPKQRRSRQKMARSSSRATIALLTLCLALATTIKISKEINAMEAKKLKETAILSLSQEKTSQQFPNG